MKLHISYGRGNIIHNTSTNTTTWPYEDLAEKTITFELNDYPLTNKFIIIWKKMWENAKLQEGGRYFSQEQSVQTDVSEESILESRRHHNSLIRELQ